MYNFFINLRVDNRILFFYHKFPYGDSLRKSSNHSL